ncbi:hydroxymyristoyl-ACP dehydratase [Aeromonas salmonicida]|uniref:ApeI family dehydratase n=1 Tax=Aeromonas salmonicida TaxID=645 RepID=UPI0024A905C7|nr:hydroxymyristoyl-ACP dehydratase [Aeromonas salmonicida]MDM5135099.1 hydroxymyristoyl-ACP dehydratase [Aeromonas salmonicida]WHF41210.1 hydroxymyristoyl-ACP dehydratase [Aeromonas salmonicida]
MSLSADTLPMNSLPTVLGSETLADGVRLHLRLDPELSWFAGHFPGAPLLPGVTQIHWVMHYATSRLNLELPFHGLDQLKFQRPLRPGAECSLSLQWQPQKDQLVFSYALGDELASSGRVRFIP